MQNHICAMVMFLCVHVNKAWVTRTDFKGLLESEVTIGLGQFCFALISCIIVIIVFTH